MLYHLFNFLEERFRLPGSGLWDFITFRASMAIILSLVISIIIGRGIISRLRKMQVGEVVRDLGLEGQNEKKGTPTMGGIIMIAAIVVPVLLFARLDNIYVLLALVATVWMGVIGFLDDYIKVFKKDKNGLRAKFKIMAQVGLGIIVGTALYVHPEVTVRDHDNIYVYQNVDGKASGDPISVRPSQGFNYETGSAVQGEYIYSHDHRSLETNIPFLKNNSLDYARILSFLGEGYEKWSWLFYIPFVIFIITAVSNAANLTDGIDGLATGVSAIIMLTLGVFAYVSGNVVIADYLNIMYIPNSGELVVYSAAIVGACLGFLWYNTYPAQVFMGDTGSLMLGGLIATIAIMVRKELLLPILCGVFMVETLSVMIQVAYFKYQRRRRGLTYAQNNRVFKMTPLHHHYQKLGYHEAKIVMRFFLVGILLAVLSVITLKIR
jgi:phospho-N-acetylmuramoyl-pentapeptide-transferase